MTCFKTKGLFDEAVKKDDMSFTVPIKFLTEFKVEDYDTANSGRVCGWNGARLVVCIS